MSQVRLIVVMDPIEAINPVKDSTLAILLAAHASKCGPRTVACAAWIC